MPRTRGGRSYRGALGIAGAGVLTFGVVYALLQLTGPAVLNMSKADGAPSQPPKPANQAVATDSLASRLASGQMAVGVPMVGSEPLLREVHAGDRLDVLASLQSPTQTGPVTGVVVRGATVLRSATADDPLVLQVEATDAVVLAHLVSSGTRLGYVVWPAGASPVAPQPISEATARALFGLSVATSPTPGPSAAVPASPTLAPTGTPSPAMYVVQAGDSLESIAARLDVEAGALWWANRALLDPGGVVPGMQLRAPRARGFLYQVQQDDSWDSVAAIFGMSASDLRQRNNAPSEDTALAPGAVVFVPRLP